MKLAILYAIFASIATVTNIGAQDLSLHVYAGAYALPVSIFIGTGVGLVVKYVLDKRYIFQFRTQSQAHNGRTFMLYTAMGLLTTAIFWGFEALFQILFQTREMRYLGAVLGLSLGYILKYRLDRRFVFVSA
jgi:putative flippase GtrA